MAGPPACTRTTVHDIGHRYPAATAALLPAALLLRLLLNRWELVVHHPFKTLLDVEFDVEHAGAIRFDATRLHHDVFASYGALANLAELIPIGARNKNPPKAE